MLVLSRKEFERIRIGEDIEIEVVRISANKVRIGISAPRDLKIIRTELIELESEPEPENESVAV